MACGPLILNIENISLGEKPAVMPVKVNSATVKRGHHTSWSTVTCQYRNKFMEFEMSFESQS